MTALIELYRTDHHALVAWICKEYGIGGNAHENPHRLRRETIARRLRLYRDDSVIDVIRDINRIYETDSYKETLRKYVPLCVSQNVTRRIVDEVASLYDRPALRQFKDEPATEKFRAEEKRLRLHEVAQGGHRLLTLCNELLEWQFTGADGKTKIRLVTPDTFDAIPHPADGLVEAGLLIDMLPRTVLVGEQRNRLPHYEIWDDKFRYLISANGVMVDENGQMVSAPKEHGYNRIPGVLQHRREPVSTLLDCSHGSDVESAHRAIALLDVMVLRLSKSQGERQPILSGNLAAMASGQVMNGETPINLPPEVVASMLETKTDPDHYLRVKKDIITSVAQTYGMSYEQFSLNESADSSSGKTYALRREKLTEIRLESRRRAVVHEGERAELMGFDTEGFRVDYQEQAIPSDAVEEVSLLRDKMKMGLDSPVTFLMRKDSDLDRKAATKLIEGNLRDYAVLMKLVRALNMPADGDAENPGKSPQENGASNQAKGDEEEKPPIEGDESDKDAAA